MIIIDPHPSTHEWNSRRCTRKKEKVFNSNRRLMLSHWEDSLQNLRQWQETLVIETFKGVGDSRLLINPLLLLLDISATPPDHIDQWMTFFHCQRQVEREKPSTEKWIRVFTDFGLNQNYSEMFGGPISQSYLQDGYVYLRPDLLQEHRYKGAKNKEHKY